MQNSFCFDEKFLNVMARGRDKHTENKTALHMSDLVIFLTILIKKGIIISTIEFSDFLHFQKFFSNRKKN